MLDVSLSEGRGGSRSVAAVVVGLLVIFSGCARDEVRVGADAPPEIEIRGTTEPLRALTVSALVDGSVVEVPVREGESTTAGKVVALLSNPSIERDSEIARAQVELLSARSTALAPARPSSSNRGEVASRLVALRRERLERYRQLRKTHDVSEAEVAMAEAEYLGALREEAAERRDAVVVTPSNRITALELSKARAEEKFARSRETLLRPATPIAGTITAVHVVPGQVVFPHDPLVDIVDVTSLRIRGEVAPELVRYLRPRTRVEVKLFTVPPRTFVDEIDQVVPTAGVVGATRGASVYVTIPNPDGSLQPNTPAVVTVRAIR
jgi:HlyD family secretion protein